MIKSWLIRTKNNHILGPVSKEKIQQLIGNGSIKGDDEICSGNGYWFFVRENELVQKYVFGDIVQDFNPVQESMPVLTQISSNDRREAPSNKSEDGAVLPSESDLMYPGEDNSVQSQTNDTAVGIELSNGSLKKRLPSTSPQSSILASENELDRLSSLRDRAVRKSPIPNKKEPSVPNIHSSKSKKVPEVETQYGSSDGDKIVKASLSGKKLIFITLIFIIFGSVLLYFRGTLVKKLIEASAIVLPNAYAQTFKSDKKKSGLINPL